MLEMAAAVSHPCAEQLNLWRGFMLATLMLSQLDANGVVPQPAVSSRTGRELAWLDACPGRDAFPPVSVAVGAANAVPCRKTAARPPKATTTSEKETIPVGTGATPSWMCVVPNRLPTARESRECSAASAARCSAVNCFPVAAYHDCAAFSCGRSCEPCVAAKVAGGSLPRPS